MNRHAVVTHRGGHEWEGLDLSLEYPQCGRAAIIHRQAKFGTQINKLATRRKNGESACPGGAPARSTSRNEATPHSPR